MILSIIIPSFNNLSGLKNCVLSIQNQSFKSYEVWIIDNASTDGTIRFLKTLEFPFNWVSEKDLGIYDAMNKGISKAKGKWFYFIGTDDKLYNKDVLKTVFLNTHANVQLIYGNIKYDFTENDTVFVKNNDGFFKSSYSKMIWLKNTIHHQSAFYHHTIFKNLKYNTNYHILADYELNLKLIGKKILASKVNLLIALCSTSGVSKKYNWDLYTEEIKIKTKNSSNFLKPIFVVLGFVKYLVKKVN